ncbi:MAG: HEAT repeat domain-containing protein, partial [Gemmatimonadales bacterium]
PPPPSEPAPGGSTAAVDAGALVFAPAAARAQESDAVLGELGRNPTAANADDLLAVLGRQVEIAVRTGRIEQAMTIVAGIVRCEQRVPEAGSVRRHYAIALKRMYTKPLLDGLASLVQIAGHEAEAITALQRSGAAGAEVLLDLLVSSPTLAERRGVFNALGKMREGTDQLIHMLGHHQWYVVRNVAELAGELGLDEAVPALAKQVEHPDERVRKAVALALAKIASPRAAEPLRRALRDKSPEVRIQAAVGVGGRKSSALAMPLVVAMEQEENEEVERELILALGRIGSPDAVQALIKFAQPTGRLFGRRPTALRVAAVEALRLAGTPAAVGTLQGLGGDSDRPVRAAAQAALADLKK